jgi:hypothetical protein
MIEPFKHGDKWLLAYGVEMVGGQGITGSRSPSNRARKSFMGCWTGQGWSGQSAAGMTFDTLEDAGDYLVEHEHEMGEPR